MATRVSLAELSSAGLPLHPSEAAAIVQEVCRQYVRGAVRGIPSAHVIRLTRDGHVVAEGPISPNQPPIVRAAQLLNDLLPPFDASPPYRVPGGLRLIVARALGTIDLPPFESLDEFCAALDRFSAQNLDSAAQNLFRSYEDSRGPKPLTISDVRRARRATGLSLEDISAVCGLSVSLLRELEWGDLRNWRRDDEGRQQIARYARAAGLDEELVLSITDPLIAEAGSRLPEPIESSSSTEALVPAGPQVLVPAFTPSTPPRRTPLSAWLLAAASVILLIVALTAALWRPEPPAKTLHALDTRLADETGPVAPPAATPPVIHAINTHAPATAAARIGRTLKAPSHAAKIRSTRRASARKSSFFRRELFRIVIR